jgi:hypothetical protein
MGQLYIEVVLESSVLILNSSLFRGFIFVVVVVFNIILTLILTLIGFFIKFILIFKHLLSNLI